MADKVGAKKPLITPGGAKNIAAAKAAFGPAGASSPSNGTTGSPAARSRAAAEAAKTPDTKKDNDTDDAKSTAAAATAATTGKGAAPATAAKGGAPATQAPADKEEEKKVTTSTTPKPSKAAPVSDESSPEESSDESDEDGESNVDSDASDHKKKKKIDIGVSLSSIKAAFQQDNQQRQQVKKGYDAEEFKKQVKDASSTAAEAAVENEPEAQNPDVIRSAVLSDLGLDALKKANASSLKDRFEHYNENDHKTQQEKDELLQLKERSAASANKAKWENPEQLVINPDKEERHKEDIEVAASKATKMKEKFERKARKEEKKAKTPKPKARSSVQADHHE
ncbi:hypothetical protein RvY_03751-2 [Ramazzottius varieornatus]|uniref:Uncharacterized protein n=1 Tax=Ramazzottius varieornatus TaxID=947166 RepID=A0A1D1UUT8_RAMVA|nr:hypothetical protein RvY_03751-2 [Ramazzottius varieornatus]